MLSRIVPLVIAILFVALNAVQAQQPVAVPEPPASPGPPAEPKMIPIKDSVLVTVILKHQQGKNLQEIRRVLEAQGFWDLFPPEDARIISWTLAMGLGHVVVLQVPAAAVRRLNLALENGAWGAFDTEIYITYNYKTVWEDYLEQRAEAREDRN